MGSPGTLQWAGTPTLGTVPPRTEIRSTQTCASTRAMPGGSALTGEPSITEPRRGSGSLPGGVSSVRASLRALGPRTRGVRIRALEALTDRRDVERQVL